MSLASSTEGADPAVDALLDEYARDARAHRIGKRFLASREEIVGIVRSTLELLFPGYWGATSIEPQDLRAHIARSVASLRTRLQQQVALSLLHREEAAASAAAGGLVESAQWGQLAARIADVFIDSLPAIRRALLEDVSAAFTWDPAAKSVDEVVLAYPGVLAVSVYRIAHTLHKLGVPLLPRVLTEWAHSETGADIHPGATIGASFFIDHATGVVIGETALLGDRVRLYQGVTLGARSAPHDVGPRGARRHPVVESDVTIYANATILGGQTTIGAGSVIAAGSFITASVPAGTRVGAEAQPAARASVHGPLR